MTQQEFLRDAKDRLGMTWKAFADRIGAPETTLKKWLALPGSQSNYREMPSTIWTLVKEIIDHEALKKKHTKLQEKVSKNG